MENQLEIIKSNLPYGYEGIIAEKVGCSKPDIGSVVILGGLTFVNSPLCIHLC